MIADDYVKDVPFFALEAGSRFGDVSKIGGVPNWVSGDESPATYDATTPMVFLLDLMPGIQFTTIEGHFDVGMPDGHTLAP